jgi:hypothetical protein
MRLRTIGRARSAETNSSPKGWRVGAVVDGYLLLGELGTGGLGRVYRAKHCSTDAERAIKTFCYRPDAEELARFQREGESHARIDAHPHVLRIHSAGAFAGQPYLVLDLAEGGSLAERLRAGPMGFEEAARMVRDLARGLAHVHAHGVVHRDLKPANVLFDADGRARLADFGLARLSGSTALTETGDILGTPAYMAPEQAKGDQAAIGVATDVHGLGTVLYACLTGRAPFSGRSPVAALANVVNRIPSPRASRPEVPIALERICARALAKDPSDRFQSGEALALALEAFLTPQSQPLGVGMVVAAVVAVTGFIAVGWLTIVKESGSPKETPRSELQRAAVVDGPPQAPVAVRETEPELQGWPAIHSLLAELPGLADRAAELGPPPDRPDAGAAAFARAEQLEASSIREALPWAYRAAAEGNLKAVRHLGSWICKEDQNFATGGALLLAAAEAGDDKSLLWLGHSYAARADSELAQTDAGVARREGYVSIAAACYFLAFERDRSSRAQYVLRAFDPTTVPIDRDRAWRRLRRIRAPKPEPLPDTR